MANRLPAIEFLTERAKMLLDRNQFLVKERVAVLKLTDAYDVFDIETGEPIGMALDEPGTLAKFLRLVIDKRLLSTSINIYDSGHDSPSLSLRKKPGLFRITVEVHDAEGMLMGSFRNKLFSLGGGFLISDAQGNQVAEVKGDWKGWNFRVIDRAGTEIGLVTKKWAGLGKELFTSADNYVVSLTEAGIGAGISSALVLAAGLAIDIVFKER